jgi:hypothetical protein
MSKATELELAEWVFHGLQGPLFDVLIPFYSWARSVLGDASLAAKVHEYLVHRCSPPTDELLGSGPMSGPAMVAALEAIAADRPDLFANFLPYIARNMAISPLIIRATVALSSPPDDAFYTELTDAPTPCAVAGYQALAALNRRLRFSVFGSSYPTSVHKPSNKMSCLKALIAPASSASYRAG